MRILKFRLRHSLFLNLMLLAACTVGPDYQEPAKPVAPHWKKNNCSVSEKPYQNTTWWTLFRDPTLTKLINEGYLNNINVQSAGVKVLQARANLAQSVGELYPQQQAMLGNYAYNRIGGGSLQQVLPSDFDTASLGFTLNWEIDFWGKYRRAIQAKNATFLASLAAYDQALITLTADIASSYIKIRTIESQIYITQANIQVQKIGLQLAQVRYRVGQTSLIDVEQAKTELAETQGSLPPLISNLQKQKDTLSVLLGKPPNQLDCLLNAHSGIPKAPVYVAAGIPKETLANRPDIAQARFEAVAQSEMIGATKANLFPSLSLAGTFLLSSNNIDGSAVNNLFSWSNRAVTAGPGLNWPLFNYGQITNAVRAQDAAYQQALLNYVNVVLRAQQEVQDNITTFIEAKIAVNYLTEANRAAIVSLKLALLRYKEGETDFTPVLNAEQQQLRVQSSLVNAQGDIPQTIVALYRSLGGGWEIRRGNDVIPEKIKREMAARTNWGTLLQQESHQAPTSQWQRVKELYLPKW